MAFTEKIGTLTKTSTTQVQLTGDSIIKLGGQQRVLQSPTLLTSVSGIGGLDTGAIAASSFYYVYAVYNGSATGIVASLSASSPSGFTRYKKVGAFYTDSGSLIVGICKQDTVAASGINTIGTNITTTIIPFNTIKNFDTHNALTSATGVFVAPEDGYYTAYWGITFASIAYAQGDIWYSYLRKNGVNYAAGSYNRCEAYQTIAQSGSSVGSSIVYLTQGENVSIVGVNTNSGGVALLTTAGANHFSIEKN
jgi:hypothetical protein